MNSALCGRPKDVPTRKAGAKLLHFPDIHKKKRNYFQTVSHLWGYWEPESYQNTNPEGKQKLSPLSQAGSIPKGLYGLFYRHLFLFLHSEELDDVAYDDAML